MRAPTYSLSVLLVAQLSSSFPTPNSNSPPSRLQTRSPNPQLGALLNGLVGGLGSLVTGLGSGLGVTLDCTIGVLVGGCGKQGGPLGNVVEGLFGGVGGILNGLGSGLGSTLNNTLGPLVGGKGPGQQPLDLGASIEGLVGGLGNVVGDLGKGVGNTLDNTLNPLFGSPRNGNNGNIQSREPQPAPQLGNLLSGLLGGVGSAVGGLATGLGSTVNGLGTGLSQALGGLLGGSAPAPAPRPAPAPAPAPVPALAPRPAPSPRPGPTRGPAPAPPQAPPQAPWPAPFPQGPPSSNGGKKASTSVTTSRDSVSCRKYPDTLNTESGMLPFYSMNTRIDAQCWTNAAVQGNSGRVDGESLWLRTHQNCFINKAEIRENEDFKATLNECPPTKRWVGMLQSQYTRKDCYDCTSLDCPSKNIGDPPYVDLECHVQGEKVRDDTKWYKSKDTNCYFPAAVFNPNAWLGSTGGTCRK